MSSSSDTPPLASTLLDTGVEAEPGDKPGSALRLGGVFGRYVVLQRVGCGGAGTVYAAYDPELDRKVALKVLNDERPRARHRLMREAQAIAKVTHTNIVSVHDVGTDEGRVYLAMEFVDGQTLRRWLRAQTRGWREVLAKLLEAGRGLAAAHDAGLVHRDFKPDNVLVCRTGRVVVLDFGLARRTLPTGELRSSEEDREIETVLRAPRHTPLDIDITRAGALMGTPAYMAPEQHLRERVDARSDQFAFCVVLWEAIYGERPFAGRSAAETRQSTTRGDVSEPRRASSAPLWVRRVLEQGLRARAQERHADMRALMRALQRDPWRARRRAAGIGSVALAAAAVGYVVTPSDVGDSSCAPDPGRWAGVWDQARRDRIQRAFASTGLRYAGQTFAAVSSALDGYVDRWNTLHREACEAALVHGLQPRAALELQWSCLGRRRGEVAALTDELLVADARVVEHAAEAVRQLRRLDSCTDVDALGREPALPRDEHRRERVEILRSMLVDARAKSQAARYEQAIEIMRDVVRRGDVAGEGAIIAEAKLELGVACEAVGRFEEAQRWLLEAIWAGQAIAYDEVVAEAWTRLVWVVGVELLETNNAERWGRFADAAVIRVGDPPDLRAQLIHNQGGVLYRQGRLDEALDHYTRALGEQTKVVGSEHPLVATTLNHIANTLIELGRYDEAHDYAKRSLALRQRTLGPDHPKVAASLNNIAELRRKQDHDRGSLAAANESLAIVAGTGGPEELVALALAGTALVRLGQWEKASSALQRALVLGEAAEGAHHTRLVGILRDLAAVRAAQGDMGQATLLRLRASAIDEGAEPGPQ